MRKRVSLIALILLFGPGRSVWAQEAMPAMDSASPIQVSSEPPRTVHFSTVNQTPVAVRSVPQQTIDSLQRSDDYWYANLEPEKKAVKKPDGDPGLLGKRWFWNLVWIVALCGIIAAVLWYLASSNVRLFRREAKPVQSESEEGSVTDDVFSINYDKEIRKAEEASDYRLALRLWYLQTLKDLAGRNLITYRAETPNGDYLTALYGSRYYRDFFQLTRIFEYAWYGQFALSADAYQTVRPQFQNFKNSLPA